MKTKREFRQTKLVALAVLATGLAVSPTPVSATLNYNSGGVVDVNALQTDPSPGAVRVDVSNGTTLNWATGADYAPTGNFLSTVDETGFRVGDTAVLNLSGGNFTANDLDANVGFALVGSVAGNYSGSISMSGGTLSITESQSGAAYGFLFGTNGPAPLTMSVSGGAINVTESQGGNARILDVSGGARVNATISGGTFTLTESGNGSTKFFHIGGANTVASVLVTGGDFSGSQVGATDNAYVFDMSSQFSELWIRGGSFSGNLTTNVVDNGAVYLFGTFPGIADGVYTEANWIDGTIVGGALELGGTLGNAPTAVNAGGRLYINVVPEPSAGLLAGLGLLGALVCRRRARA